MTAGQVIAPYQLGGGGGLGGLVILIEQEIGLGEDIVAPDLAGWRQERYPCEEPHNWISIPLDWICEVLAPATRTVTIGLVDRTYVHPREVFADPITDRATAVIPAHNHPSGDVTPSEDEKRITQCLKTDGKLLGIHLLDHIIFSHQDHYSALENGEI